jgi:hypothetical protein
MDEKEKREILAENFPSNSIKPKKDIQPEKKPEGKKVEKVVSGGVRKQKKGFCKKLAETFMEDDSKSVGSYVLYDILIPAAKDLIVDMISSGAEMLFGTRRTGRGYGRIPGSTWTSYGGRYNGGTSIRDPRDRDRRDGPRTARLRQDFEEIIFDTRADALEVLDRMQDLINDYRMVSVSDYYTLCDMESNFTDRKYGWTDLHGVAPQRARGGGYILDLPRTQLLE